MKPILTGKVLWSYDYEVSQRNTLNDIGAHFTGTSPFHKHSGEVTLTDQYLLITGEEEIVISLGKLEQIYLGFDDVFPRSLVKNFGLFWQPLRLSLQTGPTLYLIIDYNIMSTKNQVWFDTLKNLLSE